MRARPPATGRPSASEADRWQRHPAGLPLDADLEFLASVLDDRFRVPGTNIRFGLDAVIGLIPGVGDAVTAGLSTYLIWRAHGLGVSKFTLMRMAGNTVFDTVVGAVPLIGDILDVSFRANRRNIELLRRHIEKQQGRL